MNNLEILHLVKYLSLEQTAELAEKINMIKNALSDNAESRRVIANPEADNLSEYFPDFSEEIQNEVNDMIDYERILELERSFRKFFNEKDALRLLFPNFVPLPLTPTCQSVSG